MHLPPIWSGLPSRRSFGLTRSSRQGGEPIPRCDRRCPAEYRQGRRARYERARNPLVRLSATKHSKHITKQSRGHREYPWAPAKPPAQRRDHLGDRERFGFGYDQGPLQRRVGAQHGIDGHYQIINGKKRTPSRQAAKRKREGLGG